MRSFNYSSGLKAVLCLAVLVVSGCVYTSSDFSPSKGFSDKQALAHKNEQDIVLSEGKIDRHYVVIGSISATGRAVNLMSSNPTRADVDEELRARAAEIGADAVIMIKYKTDSQGLSSRGVVRAEGTAVVFSK